MKRDFLEKTGLSHDQIDAVMSEYGKSVELLRASCRDAEEKLKAAGSVSSDIDAVRCDYENKLASVQAEYQSKLDSELSEKNKKLDEALELISKKEATISSLNSDLDGLREQISSLSCKLSDLQNRIANGIAAGTSFSSPSAKAHIIEKIRREIESGCSLDGMLSRFKDEDPSAFAYDSADKPIFAVPASDDTAPENDVGSLRFLRHRL